MPHPKCREGNIPTQLSVPRPLGQAATLHGAVSLGSSYSLSSSEWHQHTRSQEDSLGKPPNSISCHFFEKTELGHENVWNMGAMLLIFT